MYKFILSSLLCLISLACFADDDYKMQITLKDSITYEISLTQKPIVTFTDTTLNISTDSIVCELSEIETFVFTGGPQLPTSITEAPQLRMKVANRTIYVEGLTEMEPILVSDIRGMVQDVEVVYDGDRAIIYLTNLQKGIYIIRIKNKTLKFTLR